MFSPPPNLDACVCSCLRGLFLQMFKLWDVKVDGGNGKELYGNDYADIYAMQRLHFKAAMNSECDHVSIPKIDQDRDWGNRGDNSFHSYTCVIVITATGTGSKQA